MYTTKSSLLILFLTFSSEFVFGQNSDAICLGRLVQPYDAEGIDSLAGSAILTDSNTYRWIRGYILSSSHAYSPKEVGLPACPISSPALEIKDSTGMDMFVCFKDWRPFFDTLRSKLQQNQMDTVVINAFKNPPHWPITPTTTKKFIRIN